MFQTVNETAFLKAFLLWVSGDLSLSDVGQVSTNVGLVPYQKKTIHFYLFIFEAGFVCVAWDVLELAV